MVHCLIRLAQSQLPANRCRRSQFARQSGKALPAEVNTRRRPILTASALILINAWSDSSGKQNNLGSVIIGLQFAEDPITWGKHSDLLKQHRRIHVSCQPDLPRHHQQKPTEPDLRGQIYIVTSLRVLPAPVRSGNS